MLSVTVPSAGSINAPNSYFELIREGKVVARGAVDLSHSNAGDKWVDIGLIELKPGDYIDFVEVEDEPGRFYADAIKLTLYKR